MAQTKVLYDSLTAEKHRFGLIFGLLAGFTFSFFVWGIDAILLAQSHAIYPWLKFIIGGVPVIAISGFVGWLAYKVNNLLVSFLLWFANGLFCSWLSAHLPFEIMGTVIPILNPELGAIVHYPFLIGATARAFIIFIAVTGLSTLAGMLQVNLVDSATTSAAPLMRILPIVLWVFLFYLAAQAPSQNVYQEMRDPVVSVDRLIRLAQYYRGQEVAPQVARDTGYNAVKGVLDLIDRPRKLIITSYDETLTAIHVVIDFQGQWADCYALRGRPSNCAPVTYEKLIKSD